MGQEAGVAFSQAHLDARSSFCSSGGWEAEAWSSRSWFCSRSMEKDGLCWSFLWVTISFRDCQGSLTMVLPLGLCWASRLPRAGTRDPDPKQLLKGDR